MSSGSCAKTKPIVESILDDTRLAYAALLDVAMDPPMVWAEQRRNMLRP